MARLEPLRPGLVSERRLARSVAQRLKYYIDVQRREDSFNSLGVISDETESLYWQPACLTDQKEHDFANIKLEAYLRAFIGTAEECNRKVQKSPEKLKDLEQHIKNMAQNYIPERKNKGKRKNTGRQKRLYRTPHSLHITAIPFMSPEEVQRIVSSASKLIVAAISEISPEEKGITEENVSFLKRREAKSIHTMDHDNKQHFSSTFFYKDGARRAKQERKKGEDKKKTMEISNISSNSAKSKRFFSRPLAKPTAKGSLNISSIVSCLQTGENKVIKKSILKNTTSGTTSVISEHQNKRTPNAQGKTFSLSQENPHDSGGCFSKTLKIEREKFSHRPGEIISGKTNEASNSTSVSGFTVLHGQSDHMSDQDNKKNKLLGDSERNWSQKSEQNTCDSVSKKNSESDQVYFENFQQGYIPGIVNHEYNCLDCYSLHHLRGPENAVLASAMVGKPNGHVACVQKDENNDPVYLIKHGSSFLSKICQDNDQDSSASLTKNNSVTTDENEGNQSTHSFLNPPFSLNELGENNIIQDPANCMKITLEESCEQQCIPPKMPDGSSCSELLSDCVNESLQQQSSGSLVIASAISEKLESEQSEEEFTMSSASSSLSAVSVTWLNEQRNGNAKDDDSADSSMEMGPGKVLKVMLENDTTWQDIIFQDRGKQRITAEEKTSMGHGTEDICTSRTVYFSHFPKSF